jgi:hypothetical protein
MLDKLKGLWHHKGMIKRPGLSLNQAVGAGHPELKPLERSRILNEGGSLQKGGGHAEVLRDFLAGGGRAQVHRRGTFLVKESNHINQFKNRFCSIMQFGGRI